MNTTIRIHVEPTNPGQYFACCGLLELADRLWSEAEGWFDGCFFCIRTQQAGSSLSKLLSAAHAFRLAENPNNTLDEGISEEEDTKASPLILVSPIEMRLDWWKDNKALKPWAGTMDARKIFLAMCNAIDPEDENPLNQKGVVFDPGPESNLGVKKTGGKVKKREPFYFDARRGSNAWPIDIGFSTDKLDMTTVAYPVVETLCIFGLQRCRPKPTESPRVFDYFTWQTPLSISVVPLAVSGLIGNGNSYRFENAFRTDQKKHKAFNPATLLQRSKK